MTKHRRPTTEATIFSPHFVDLARSQQAQISPVDPSGFLPQDGKIDRFETVFTIRKNMIKTNTTEKSYSIKSVKPCSDLSISNNCDPRHEPVMLHNNNLPRIFAAAQHLDTPNVLPEHPRHSW
jgi:hypothetical protein